MKRRSFLASLSALLIPSRGEARTIERPKKSSDDILSKYLPINLEGLWKAKLQEQKAKLSPFTLSNSTRFQKLP